MSAADIGAAIAVAEGIGAAGAALVAAAAMLVAAGVVALTVGVVTVDTIKNGERI
jgi:hypothetical protein